MLNPVSILFFTSRRYSLDMACVPMFVCYRRHRTDWRPWRQPLFSANPIISEGFSVVNIFKGFLAHEIILVETFGHKEGNFSFSTIHSYPFIVHDAAGDYGENRGKGDIGHFGISGACLLSMGLS